MAMIVDLLPAFYGHKIPSVRYELLQSFMIEEHEVAWMRSVWTGRKNPDSHHWAFELKCECNFTEGVAWTADPSGERTYTSPPICPLAMRVREDRLIELRRSYQIKYIGLSGSAELHDHVRDIALDLLEQQEMGMFVHGDMPFGEAHVRAMHVGAITGVDTAEVFEEMDALKREGLVELNSLGISRREVPAPEGWSVHKEQRAGGWTARALLPDDEGRIHAWRFQLVSPERTLVQIPIGEYILLEHPIDFGVDMEDEERADERLNRLLSLAQEPKFPAY